MKLRIDAGCSFKGILAAPLRRANERSSTRLAAAALLVAVGGFSPFAHAATGLQNDAIATVVTGTGALDSTRSAAHDAVRPGHGVLGNGGERLALNGVDWPPFAPASPNHVARPDASSVMRPIADTNPMRIGASPEPSELALLGDGLLVLIAWIAARQTRRSRAMSAKTFATCDRD